MPVVSLTCSPELIAIAPVLLKTLRSAAWGVLQERQGGGGLQAEYLGSALGSALGGALAVVGGRALRVLLYRGPELLPAVLLSVGAQVVVPALTAGLHHLVLWGAESRGQAKKGEKCEASVVNLASIESQILHFIIISETQGN